MHRVEDHAAEWDANIGCGSRDIPLIWILFSQEIHHSDTYQLENNPENYCIVAHSKTNQRQHAENVDDEYGESTAGKSHCHSVEFTNADYCKGNCQCPKAPTAMQDGEYDDSCVDDAGSGTN